MASHPILTVLEQSHVSPPPATVSDRSLPLTYFDFLWLREPPVHNVFFYEFPLTKTQFVETIVPSLKQSLSITLQHFFPFVGKLVLFPPKKPEIRYVEGDSVKVTFAECNLDFDDLTGNHPRDCDKFYDLIPQLGQPVKTSDNIKIPVFAVQVTFFPNRGFSIGLTNHHTLGDASTRFIFLKAWTSIAKSGNDESFLTNGTLPLYDRLAENTKLGESYLKFAAKYDTITENYALKTLSGPTDEVRATFVLTRNVLNQLKKSVLTELPTIAYASSFTVACAYVWNCLATASHDGRQMFGFSIDCRGRINPPVPVNYFGNCLSGCFVMEKTTMLTGKEGFVNAAKLLGEALHKTLTNKNGPMLDLDSVSEFFADGMPSTMIGVAGTPKLKSYDIDFGWGKPKKVETISLDFNGSISMNACKESSDDLEIGVVLPANEMDIFVRTFQDGLQSYI
ncbi:malonyl-coenzyme A:anthocyanin 3-O-glucoside-6''-O-malonyltransferase-like protein [Tanacetum coccineum]